MIDNNRALAIRFLWSVLVGITILAVDAMAAVVANGSIRQQALPVELATALMVGGVTLLYVKPAYRILVSGRPVLRKAALLLAVVGLAILSFFIYAALAVYYAVHIAGRTI